MDSVMITYIKSKFYNSRGGTFLDQGNLTEAEQNYRKAVEQSPSWSVPWYNLGLIYKRQKKWRDSMECNQKAVAYKQDDVDAWWNLGIAATALRAWEIARKAWKAAGIQVPEGEGELHMQLALTPIRLNPGSSGEVVWCDRIDPARAIIRNVPLPESGHQYGDLILHDDAPNGYRIHNDQEVPVFDELERLVPSLYRTFGAVIEVGHQSDLEALNTLVEKYAIGMENWSMIRWLCKACSEGRPHDHANGYPEADTGQIRVGFAVESKQELEQILSAWTIASSQRAILSITNEYDE